MDNLKTSLAEFVAAARDLILMRFHDEHCTRPQDHLTKLEGAQAGTDKSSAMSRQQPPVSRELTAKN